MTLPRELALVNVNGSPVLSTKVVKEIDAIAGEWKDSQDGICSGGETYEIKFNVDLNKSTVFTIGNGVGQYLEVEVNPAAGKLIAKRTSTTGEINFNNSFSIPSLAAPFNTEGNTMELHIYIDNSSVEIINGDGTMAITCLVFPSVPYDRVNGVDGISYRSLNSIW